MPLTGAIHRVAKDYLAVLIHTDSSTAKRWWDDVSPQSEMVGESFRVHCDISVNQANM